MKLFGFGEFPHCCTQTDQLFRSDVRRSSHQSFTHIIHKFIVQSKAVSFIRAGDQMLDVATNAVTFISDDYNVLIHTLTYYLLNFSNTVFISSSVKGLILAPFCFEF